MIRISLLLLVSTVLFASTSFGKGNVKPGPASSAQIIESLEKLNVLGSVLYIAAHPDDENTRLISWLANDKKVKTGYLSLTRGDGGQNLIGTEKGELIGVLRTQELIEARKIDGGYQFFSRAVDFGYSKSTKETLEKWNEEEVLRDMVWVIRTFKPDVIITRFPATEYAGHGHHSASAELAHKAFEMAADPKVFPEQLRTVTAWRTKRLYQNTSTWWDKDLETTWQTNPNTLRIDVGTYNANLGKWNNQMAMESRSQHKSQGFGADINRGEQFEFLTYVKGDKAQKDIFDGIDLSWKRLAKTDLINKKLQLVLNSFNPRNPSASVPDLVGIYRLMDDYQYVSAWMAAKKEELKQIIFDASGLWIEAVSDQEYAVAGQTITVHTSLINAGKLNSVEVDSVSFPGKDTALFSIVDQNKWQKVEVPIVIPENASITQPYWLMEDYENMFKVNDPMLIGMAENPIPYNVTYKMRIEGLDLSFTTPIHYKWRDRVTGENIKELSIRPELTMNLENSVIVCPTGQDRQVHVTVVNQKANMTGELSLQMPVGWEVTPSKHLITMNTKGSASVFSFQIKPLKNAQSGDFKVTTKVGNRIYDRSMVVIDYPHIHTQTVFPKTIGKVVTSTMKVNVKKVAYIMGSGDNIPEAIEQLGVSVEYLHAEDLAGTKLKQYEAIVTGIRAYNTLDALGSFQELLINYVDSGGLLIVQYNTNGGLKTEKLGPYPFKLSRDRVTYEDAPATMLIPTHELMNVPNKIVAEDFNNWVQERGLYFADKWDEQYTPLLSWNDPNEEPLKGGLLAAEYGKGAFVFTGISFFRQLPAGVPGAFRLWANIISYKRTPQK
ncbi:MAG: PIG-L family deacetylase [Flavobacteriales bacterium]|nr:PIG-L family deacetylase [Flavobacteriales bacterium]